MIRLTLVFSLLAAPVFAQSLFTTLPAAQAHCPQDTVVWLNTTRHVYRLPAQRGFGRAKHSLYACQKEADAAGDTLKKLKPPAGSVSATGTPE